MFVKRFNPKTRWFSGGDEVNSVAGEERAKEREGQFAPQGFETKMAATKSRLGDAASGHVSQIWRLRYGQRDPLSRLYRMGKYPEVKVI